MGYWSFDDPSAGSGQGAAVHDESAQGNNGTVQGNPVQQDDSMCISGKCLYFDGINDYINIPDADSLNVTQTTIAAWVKSATTTAGKYIMAKSPPSTIGPLHSAAVNDDWMLYYESGAWNYGTGGIAWWGRYGGKGEYSGWRFALDRAIPAGTDIDMAGTKLEIYKPSGEADIDDFYIYVADSADPGQITGIAARPVMEGGSTATYPNTKEGAGAVNHTGWSDGWNTILVGPLIQYLVDTYGGLADGAHILILGAGAASEPDNSESIWAGFENGSYIPKLTIVYTDNSGSGPDVPYALSTVGGGQFMARDSGTTYSATSTTDLNDNGWHYVAGTYDGSDMKIYVDGNLETTNTDFSGALPVMAGVLRIGGDYQATPANFFNGFIDEVKIYPYARTADQIRQDYAAGLAGIKSNSGVAASFGSKNDSWLTDGLVGYWKFDEPSTAGTYEDSSGNDNTGTAAGNASTTAGKYGNGGVFDGDGDYIDVDNPTTAMDVSNVTISVWVKPNDVTFEGGIVVSPIDFNNKWGLIWNDDSGGQPIVVSDLGPDITGRQANIAPTRNQWHHIVAIPSSHKLYVDGSEVETRDITESWMSYNGKLGIGRHYDSINFNGQIDEVRIYNRALSPDEVKELYEWAPGPVAWWKFDELNGATAYDSAASTDYSGGNNGYISGGATTFPTNGVLDDFNRSNTGPPPSASWSNYLNGLSVYNNTVVRGSGSENISYWNEDMGLDQEAYFTFNGAAGVSMGVVLKFDPSAGTGYIIFYYSGNGNVYIGKLTDSSTATIYSRCVNGSATCTRLDYFSAGSFAAGDSLGAHIDAAGHIAVYKESGGTWTEVGNVTDGTYAVGKIGLQITSNSTVAGALADDFGGGNAAGAPPEPALGKFGGAIEFDGNDNAVTVPPSAKLSPGNGSWTAAAWAKPEDENQHAVLIMNYVDSDNSQWSLSFSNSSWSGAGKRLWGMYTESEPSAIYRASYSTTDQIDGDWHFYSMIADKEADEVKLYVDGVEISKSTVNSGVWPDVDTSAHVTNIGDLSGSYNFKGLIDDVRVYNYARTQKQILEDMGNGPAIKAAGPAPDFRRGLRRDGL